MKLRLVNLLREFLGAVLIVGLSMLGWLDDRYPDRNPAETNGMED